MRKLFGTDGIRGIVGHDLTADLALKVGYASAKIIGQDKKIKVLLARDTRISGQMISRALSAGLMSAGADVVDIGIMPTPAVSYLVSKYNCDMGVMITASHNSYEHNGIKLFNSLGFKLDDALEEEIEQLIFSLDNLICDKLGTFSIYDAAAEDYIDFLCMSVPNINPNLKLVIDLANGSACMTAPLLFARLGINPIFIGNDYDGYNINEDCGSTHLDKLISRVKKEKSDVGIAFDGDADRCLMIDNEGNLIDGDFILAIYATYLKANHKFSDNTIVGTVMSNLGLKKYCAQNNINFVQTNVGDRYVIENMLANNHIIGGEQSGHIIFKELENSGDGQMTALQILNIMTQTKKSLKTLASIMESYPQVVVNVKVSNEGKTAYKSDADINNLIEKTTTHLGTDGRVLIRPSGTENLIRVMIEGKDIDVINNVANNIANLIKEKYGVK